MGLIAVGYTPLTLADSPIVTEAQQGDPDLPVEYVEFDRQSVMANLLSTRAVLEPEPANFGELLVGEAQSWVGRDRQNSKGKIADLLDLFGLPFSQHGSPVPFCAAGASYVAAAVYAKAAALRNSKGNAAWSSGADLAPNVRDRLPAYLTDLEHSHFLPTPSVNDMYLVAQGKHRWAPASAATTPKPGWLILFSWKGGNPDHVGIVKSVQAGSVTTIEFNTSAGVGTAGAQRQGGCVASRIRPYPHKAIKGFIRTA
ncbi:CHAP domain-containing protein [Paraburkholderia dipogonis]|nr:CHAP domain-containing protein [Paraburkholderia dipogonis]